MADSQTRSQEAVTCPICGKPAERGCLYGSDRVSLQWIEGQPNLKKNIAAAMGAGDAVGHHELFNGRYAEGIRCSSCHRIILEYVPRA